MAESKFWWIKLRTDLFDDDNPMDILMSQKNGGADYVVLYLKLCLMTANKKGRLCNEIGEMLIPYDIDKIVREAKYFNRDTVVVGLELYKKLGLIYAENDGVLTLADQEKMVGCETKYAEKMRRYRVGLEERAGYIVANDVGNNVGDNVRQEIRDKRLEIRDIDIRDKESKNKGYKAEDYTYFPDDAELESAFKDFILMRKRIKSPLTSERATKSLITKLINLSTVDGFFDRERALQIIDDSIQNNWKGFWVHEDKKKTEEIDWAAIKGGLNGNK